MTNFILGFFARKIPYFKFRLESYKKDLEKINKYGSPALLLSWLPIIGDGLCFAAGFLKINWLKAMVLIAMAKALRYGFLILIF